MFGFLKRIRHRGEDLDDIRDHVLGERFPPEIEQPMPMSEQRPKFTLANPPTSPAYQSQTYQQPYAQPPPLPEPIQEQPIFESRYGENIEPGFNEPIQLERTAERTSRDYDILDRLNLMESQLSAIRSMTETINERLKNLEVKLGTRRL